AVAARLDPDAPMVLVGLALALGPNLNMESSAGEIEAACAAARRAVTLSKSPEETGYSSAMAVRYCDSDGAARLNAAAYVNAMSALSAALPDDMDAAVLYADGLLQLRPRTVRDDARAVEVLEAVIRRHPDHVGANHYYVHAVEGTRSPERGL